MEQSATIVLRAALSFVALFLLSRFMGRQQVSHLSFFDYAAGITIGSIAATASVESTVDNMIALLVWGLLTFSLAYLSNKSVTARKLLEAEPIPVIQDGRIMEENLRVARYSVDNLLRMLRRKGIFSLGDVEAAFVEASGDLSVLQRAKSRPLQPSDLGLPVTDEEMAHIFISDGQIMHDTLESQGLDEEWLRQHLRRRGIEDISEVVVFQRDTTGSIYLDRRRDEIDPDIQRPGDGGDDDGGAQGGETDSRHQGSERATEGPDGDANGA